MEKNRVNLLDYIPATRWWHWCTNWYWCMGLRGQHSSSHLWGIEARCVTPGGARAWHPLSGTASQTATIMPCLTGRLLVQWTLWSKSLFRNDDVNIAVAWLHCVYVNCNKYGQNSTFLCEIMISQFIFPLLVDKAKSHKNSNLQNIWDHDH